MTKKNKWKWTFAVLCALPLTVCSCSSSDEENDNEPVTEIGGQGNETDGGNENNNDNPNGSFINPDIDNESTFFIGCWEGSGPYCASESSQFSVVTGTWWFYNDGNYYWEGYHNWFKYTETGKWHYNSEKKMLVTDGRAGYIWTIEEKIDNQWVGTQMGNKGGTYSYKRVINEADNIYPSNVRIIDYKKNQFVIRDTVKNYELYAGAIKCGVRCINKQDESDVKMVYTNEIKSKGIYDVTIKGLEEDGKYRLCSFIEYPDGNIEYGKEERAICITPTDHCVYLGETPTNSKVIFYAKSSIGIDGNFVEEGAVGASWSTTSADNDEIITNTLKALGEGWRLPTKSENTSIGTTCEQFGYKGKNALRITSIINGNSLILPFHLTYQTSGGIAKYYYSWYINSINNNGYRGYWGYTCDTRYQYIHFSSSSGGPGGNSNTSFFLLPVWEKTAQW